MKKTTKPKVIKAKLPKVTSTPKGTAAIPDEVSTELINGYTVTLKVFGKKYSATGSSVVDALLNLKGVGKLAGSCVLMIEHNEVKREKIINARILWGLFNGSQTMKDIGIKNVSLIFGDL